ncbi:fukutin-like [Acanthaster planci]|uniref:Fukutin-like n=1 Tax=Acanthaster planci TaxID=133434 RepID=A0A8B7Y621_ACAPL|nr:fukutin-like [Acanthaster planci]
MSHVYISRRRVLIGLVVFGALFVATQVCLFSMLRWAGHSLSLSSVWGGQAHKHPRKISPYRATKVFSSASAKFSVPVFLIEPECLTNISLLRTAEMNKIYPGQCKYLCGPRNVTTFGILDSRLISKEFFSFLEEILKMKWIILYGKDPRHLPMDHRDTPEIPLHYLFDYSGQFIHLVVFYERSNSYLWHGAVQLDPTRPGRMWPPLSCFENVDLRKLKFGGTYAGAYDKMEFTTTQADRLNLLVPKHIDRFLDQIPFSRHIECNYGQVRVFRAAYGRDESPEAQAFRQAARDLLEKGKQVLDELGIRFWLSSGTCLGWFRECDIIAHSQDVDFGIWIKDYKSHVIKELDSRGLTLKHQFGRISDSFELSFMDDSIKLDIFFFYDERDHMWNGGTEVRTGNKFKYIFPKFTLCWTELLGLKVRVPCNTRQYIEANYGQEWNQKVTTWDWKTSPPNVRPNGRWNRDEWTEVIQMF